MIGFLAATLRISTPLLLAATGELLVERSGLINLSIEGAMLAGALASAVASAGLGPWAGMGAGLLAGVLTAALFAGLVVAARANQIIAGTALTLGSVGLTGAVYRQVFGASGPGLSIPTLPAMPLPLLDRIPVLGPSLFTQPVIGYLAWLLVPLAWWFLFRTWWGLALRATGESVEAAWAMGIPVRRVRTLAALAAGGLAGLGGAALVLAQVGTFAEKMTAGRGFIAIAVVVLGRWHPAGVLLGALLLGAATALQFAFQAMGIALPYQLFLVMPYGLAVVALAGGVGRGQAPAGLGRE